MANELHKKITIWLNQQGIENNLKSVRSAIAKTTNEMAKLPSFSDEWYEKSKKLAELKGIYSEMQKEIKVTADDLKNASDSLKTDIMAIGGAASAIQGAHSILSRFVSATQEYVDAYASLDDAMTSVSKYTGLTREEVKQLNEEFQRMDTRTPIEKLNALAADAGRLGITSKEAIKDFVEAADIINIALGEDLGEDAVKNIGKMAQMFGETETMGLRGAMIATASAVNTLAQSSSASEPYIMDFSARLAGVANTAGITQAQIMGIASAMDQNMAQVERSATAVQKVMMDMMGKTEKYANLVGMTADEFRKLVDSDMNTALLTVLDKLKEIRDTGGKSAFAETLDDLKLKGAGVQDTLMMLAEKTDQLREAQLLATQAYADGNSVINEAAAVNGNAAAQLEKAKQSVQSAKAALGEELLPVITDLTRSSASGLKVLTTVVKFWTQHKALLLLLAGAYGSLRLAQKAVIATQKEEQALTLANTVAGKAYTLVTKLLAVAKAKLAADTEAAAVAQTELKAAFAATPWGAIITAVATLATGIGMLIAKHRDATKAAEEFNTECAREQAEAEYLFGKLKKAEKGTKEYEEALQQLKEKYPEIIQKHLDEEGALRDVEQAYKDVIVQIKAKIAEQLKEQKITDATTTLIDEQTKQMERLQKQLKKDGRSDSEIADIQATIREYANSGKSMKELSDKLLKDFNYYFSPDAGTDQRNPVKKFLAAQADYDTAKRGLDQMFDGFIEDGKKASDEIARIDAQIAELEKQRYGENRKEIQRQIDDLKKLKQQKLATAKAGDGTSSDSPTGTTPTGGSPKKAKKDPIADFEKKLQEFRTRQQRETMDGWEKTKQAVIDSYQKMIDEAKELNLTDVVKELENERTAAIAAAGQKWIKTASDTLQKAIENADKLLRESMPDGESPLMKAIAGEQSKWDEIYRTINENIDTYISLLNDPRLSQEEISLFQGALQKSEEALADATQKNAAAISNIIQQHAKTDTDFITGKEKELARSRMTEHDRRVAEIKEEYALRIEAKQKEIAVLEQLLKNNPENADYAKQIEELKKVIQQLEALQGKEIAAVPTGNGNKSIWQQIAEFDWSSMSTNWQNGLDLMTQGLQDFANAAFDIYNSILDIQNQNSEAELEKVQEAYDTKSAALKRQLDDGVISQKRYDAQMEKLQAEKEAKEKKLKHDQFEREKTANIIQAIIAGALSASQTLAQWGVPWGLIPMALALAVTAAQTAVIATQPNPYAKGGYIKGRQYAVMGEQGPEWVASNKLLKDEKTKDIVAALDEYQQGNTRALERLTMPAPDLKTVSQTVSGNGRTFATSNQTTTNNYYQNAGNNEQLQELRKLNDYLSDPMNRRSYISRRMQLEFEEQELEVREMARL